MSEKCLVSLQYACLVPHPLHVIWKLLCECNLDSVQLTDTEFNWNTGERGGITAIFLFSQLLSLT